MSIPIAQATSLNTVTPCSSSEDSPPKMTDGRQLVLIIVPCIALGIALIITAIAIARKLQRNARLNTLPVTERTFLKRHLDNLRSWNIPVVSPTGPAFKVDPHHRPLTLTMPASTHPPASTINGSYKTFQAKQKQRQEQRQMGPQQPEISLEPWVHLPMGSAY
jgi:hypothetical protein